MVKIEEKRLVIEIETCAPGEMLRNYVSSLLGGLKTAIDSDAPDPGHIYFIVDLLQAMQPEEAA